MYRVHVVLISALLELTTTPAYVIVPAATGIQDSLQRGTTGRRSASASKYLARASAVQHGMAGLGGVDSATGVVIDETSDMELEVLSFDLDDTLWPTEEVVWAANTKMEKFLNAQYPGTPSAKEIQSVMKSIRQARRQAAETSGTTAPPISYTELRLSALRTVTAEAGFSEDTAVEASNAAFQVWLDERNAAAGRLLFDGVPDMLKEIRRRYPSLLLCAITNGRGDVSQIPELAEYFDFSISGEDAHVFPERKPSVKIYYAAIRQALARKDATDFVEEVATLAPQGDDEVKAFSQTVARWVHVGDDLANDIGPTRELGMRTVLLEADHSWRNGISTMSPEEEAKRLTLCAAATPHATMSHITSLPQVLAAWCKR